MEKKPVTLDGSRSSPRRIMEKERRKASEDASKEPFKRYMEGNISRKTKDTL